LDSANKGNKNDVRGLVPNINAQESGACSLDSNMMSILADYPINTLYARYLTEMLGVMSDHGQPKMPSSNSYKNIEVTNNNTLTCECLTNLGMQNYLPGKGIKKIPANEDTIVPIELAQIDGNEFVPIELAQIPSVLFSTGWSNHQLIMSQCKSDEQRLFYILYSGHEQLEYKQLEPALKTGCHSS